MSASPCWTLDAGGVQDMTTGLVWGQSPSGGWSQNGSTIYSANLVEGGYDDWRLPTKSELLEAASHGIFNNVANLSTTGHWSSTTQGSQFAWAVDVQEGTSDYYFKSSYGSMVPVRGVRAPITHTMPSVRVFSQALAVQEKSGLIGHANFTVALDTQPAANITIPVFSTDISEGTIATSSLTFTSQNWSVPQWVRVTSVDDSIVDGSQTFTVDLGSAQSSDPNYNNLSVDDVTVVNIDNDTARVILANPGTEPLVTNEAGGAAAVAVTLSAMPQHGPVFVVLTSNDVSEASTPDDALMFDAANWNVPQLASIAGVPDGIADGDVKYTVQAAVGEGSSTEFLAATSTILQLTNTDVDGAVANYTSGNINRAIPDRGSVTSQINVPVGTMIGDLNVTMNIVHPNVGDLRITLAGPNNQSIVLADRRGGSGDNITGTIFDDEDATSITAAAAPFAGTFRPQSGTLARWDDASAAGAWTLKVEDLVRGTTGRLVNWSLSVREKAAPPPPPPAPLSSDLYVSAIDEILASDFGISKPKRRLQI